MSLDEKVALEIVLGYAEKYNKEQDFANFCSQCGWPEPRDVEVAAAIEFLKQRVLRPAEDSDYS